MTTTHKIEIERRWLIKLPLSETAEIEVKNEPDAPARIQQTYLTSNDGSVRRVRFVEVDIWGVKMRPHYIETTKKLIERGVNDEVENDLTEGEYQLKLLERDPDHITINKTRYHLHYKSHLFELDLFEDSWEGLAILELELKSKDETFELPPYLNIDREITMEDGWSNFDLSKRFSAPQSSWFGQRSFDHFKPSLFDRVLGWFRPSKAMTDIRL
jgi:CYTH domain-containing protein